MKIREDFDLSMINPIDWDEFLSLLKPFDDIQIFDLPPDTKLLPWCKVNTSKEELECLITHIIKMR